MIWIYTDFSGPNKHQTRISRLCSVKNTCFIKNIDKILISFLYYFQANLISKRGKLQDQLNEAKFLQENIQKRSGVVSSYLQKYFSPSEFEDFERFLDRKSKNIMEIRELSDKIALSEEQMRALTKSV